MVKRRRTKSRPGSQRVPVKRMQSAMQRDRLGIVRTSRVRRDPPQRSLNSVREVTIAFDILQRATTAPATSYGSPVTDGAIYVTFSNAGSIVSSNLTFRFLARMLCAQKLGVINDNPTNISLSVTKMKLWGASDTSLIDAVSLGWLIDTGDYPPSVSKDSSGANHRAATALSPPRAYWRPGSDTTNVFTIAIQRGNTTAANFPDNVIVGHCRVSLSYVMTSTVTVAPATTG